MGVAGHASWLWGVLLCMFGEVVPVSVRRLIVEIDTKSVNVTEFCREHGISTWFFYELRRRHRLEGEACLEPRSRAPKRVANKTALAVEDTIVRTRKQLVDAGLDAGAASIADKLRGLVGLPSESTIWRILTARGLIVREPGKAPNKTYRTFSAARANECWQIDDTTWTLADGSEAKILNIIDDHSRVLIASTTATVCTGAFAFSTMTAAAQQWKWPQRFLSDNAPAFKHVLAEAVAVLGVAATHSRPYHPQTCGKVERFHQTLKKWLNKQPRAHNITQLQDQLDKFRHIYNHQRPHRSIGRQTPATVFKAAPKTGPTQLPANTTTRASTSKVTPDGRVWFNNNRATIGTRYAGHTAHIITTGTHCHIFINTQLARHLKLDPNQTRYPLPTTVSKDPRHA